MLIIGLTGSIAMGKSQTANMFKQLGYPVFDADQTVHDLYESDINIINKIGKICPAAKIENKINRQVLSKCITKNNRILKQIETIVHPLVQEMRNQFLKKAEQQQFPFVVLDIPLLFETGRADEMDKIIVVSTSPEIQQQRALARSNLTKEKFDWILSKQIPDSEKRKRADYVVDTSISIQDTTLQVKKIIATLDPK